jgi:hypothetical protein
MLCPLPGARNCQEPVRSTARLRRCSDESSAIRWIASVIRSDCTLMRDAVLPRLRRWKSSVANKLKDKQG